MANARFDVQLSDNGGFVLSNPKTGMHVASDEGTFLQLMREQVELARRIADEPDVDVEWATLVRIQTLGRVVVERLENVPRKSHGRGYRDLHAAIVELGLALAEVRER